MTIAVETISDVERRVNIQIEWSKFDQKQQAELKKLQQRARVDGFRPGKVPLRIVKQHYGAAVMDDVLGELMRDSFVALIEEQKIDLVGQPKIEPKAIENGQPVEYTATFEVFPEFTLTDLSGQKVTKYVNTITDADVDKAIEILRGKYKTWKEAPQKAAENGDKITIDFVGKIDGEVFEGGSAENYDMVLGEAHMIEGFESGLVRSKVGETQELMLTFPEDYHKKDLAGKPVQFTVTIKNVQHAELPELNDEFLETLDIKEGGVEALRKETRENMERERDVAIENRMKKEIFKQFSDVNTVTIPQALVEMEIDHKIEEMAHRMKSMGFQQSAMPNFPRDMFASSAKDDAKLLILVKAALKEYNIEADESIVDDIIKHHVSAYNNPEEMETFFRNDKKLRGQMEHIAREKQLVDKLMETANVEEQVINYFELIERE